MVKKIPYSYWVAHIASSESFLWRGDIICVKAGERSFLNPPIFFGQLLAARDYPYRKLSWKKCWDASKYTHTALANGKYGIIEHYYPKTRKREWEDLIGREFAVIRPLMMYKPEDIYYGKAGLDRVCQIALQDVENEEPYSVRELFYYCKWGWKYLRKFLPFPPVPFTTLFKSNSGNVCSGQVWYQYTRARWFPQLPQDSPDRQPEAWYPARFLFDPLFQIRMKVKLVEG